MRWMTSQAATRLGYSPQWLSPELRALWDQHRQRHAQHADRALPGPPVFRPKADSQGRLAVKDGNANGADAEVGHTEGQVVPPPPAGDSPVATPRVPASPPVWQRANSGQSSSVAWSTPPLRLPPLPSNLATPSPRKIVDEPNPCTAPTSVHEEREDSITTPMGPEQGEATLSDDDGDWSEPDLEGHGTQPAAPQRGQRRTCPAKRLRF